MDRPTPNHPKKRTKLSSLTRLVIGSALSGYDGLMMRLSAWESELDQNDVARNEPDPLNEDESTRGLVGDWAGDNTQADTFRYAAIGMVFDAQETLANGLDSADRITRFVGGLLETVASPIYSSRFFSPLRTRIDHLAQRGQSEVDRWIEIGQEEDLRSRQLANTALMKQVDSSIEYLTSNDEVQELVQSQSVGLIGEIIEETRERTVSADNYLEAWVRTMLRRPMRTELPDPPQDLVNRAAPYLRIQGKVVKK